MNTLRRNRDILLSVFVPGLLLAIARLTIRFSYGTNDDLTMISIMNGSFTGTPDPHGFFIRYPLTWLISTLYRITDAVSWYEIVMFAIIWLAMGSILYRLLKRLPDHPVLVCTLVTGSVSILWMYNIMSFTFSTCGAFVSACTLICYALQKKEEDLKPGFLINIIILYLLSYLVRRQFCYVSTCFLGVIWLAKYAKELFSNRKCWRIPIAAFIALAIAVGINEVGYQDWGWFWTYNDARSNLHDYIGFPDYDENVDMITELGYDKAEYHAINRHDYCLLEDYDPNDLLVLSDYANELLPQKGLLSTVKSTLKKTFSIFFVDSLDDFHALQFASYLLPVALLFLSIVLSFKDKKWYFIHSFLILFGIAGIWLVIAYQGRSPMRVLYSLRILTVAASLAGIILLLINRPETEAKDSPLAYRSFTIGMTVLFLGFTLWGLVWTYDQQGAPGEVQPQEYLSYVIEHPENIYIRDTTSTQKYADRLSEFPHAPVNILASGSWSAYSPLYYAKLEAVGLDTLNRDTLFLDNCYLIINKQYSLNEILGVSSEAVIDYELIESFSDGIQILKIHSIIE